MLESDYDRRLTRVVLSYNISLPKAVFTSLFLESRLGFWSLPCWTSDVIVEAYSACFASGKLYELNKGKSWGCYQENPPRGTEPHIFCVAFTQCQHELLSIGGWTFAGRFEELLKNFGGLHIPGFNVLHNLACLLHTNELQAEQSTFLDQEMQTDLNIINVLLTSGLGPTAFLSKL